MRSSYFFVAVLFLIGLCNSQKTFNLPSNSNWPTSADVDQLRKSLVGSFFNQSDPEYPELSVYNPRTGPPRPTFIAIPSNTDDISKILAFASTYNIRVGVYSSGHHFDIRHLVDDAIVINMQNFNQNSLNLSAETVTAGPGQWLADVQGFVAHETNGKYVVLSPDQVSVGPAGWTIGGGFGPLARMYGYGADQLVSATVVLANGTLVTASATENSDLLWALRGGAGSAWGVVTSLTLKIHPDPGQVYVFNGLFPLVNSTATAYQAWAVNAPNNVYSGYYIFPSSDGGYVAIINANCYGNSSQCAIDLNGLTLIPNCLLPVCQITLGYNSYNEYLVALIAQNAVGNDRAFYLISYSFDLQTPEALIQMHNLINNFPSSTYPGISLECINDLGLGGAASQMDPTGTMTSINPNWRKSIFNIACAAVWYHDGSVHSDVIAYLDDFADNVFRPLAVNEVIYWNFAKHNFQSTAEWQYSYWGGNYPKLLSIKQKYDPNNILTCYQCVGWEQIVNQDPSSCPELCSCSNQLNNNTCAYQWEVCSSCSNNSICLLPYGATGVCQCLPGFVESGSTCIPDARTNVLSQYQPLLRYIFEGNGFDSVNNNANPAIVYSGSYAAGVNGAFGLHDGSVISTKNITLPQEFTIELVFSIDSLPAKKGQYSYLVGLSTLQVVQPSSSYILSVSLDHHGRLYFLTGSTVIRIANTQLKTGTLYNLVMTVRYTQLVAWVNHNKVTSAHYTASVSQPLYLGVSSLFNGYVYEAGVYGTPLHPNHVFQFDDSFNF